MDYYLCGESDEVLGPFADTLIVRGIVAGKVPKQTKVCAADGLGAWTALDDVDDFADAAEATRVFGLVPSAETALVVRHSERPPPPPPPVGEPPPSQRRRPITASEPTNDTERRWTEPMWLVEIDGEPRGPGTLEQIRQNVQQGVFKPDTPTRRVNESAWRPAFEVYGELSVVTRTSVRPPPAAAKALSGSVEHPFVGQTLCGRYRLERVIGSGGMGTVFEACNLKLGKRVAIKTIDRSHQLSAMLRERLKREAEVLASLASPSFVAVFDVDEDPRCGPFMVMELLKGQDLCDAIRRSGRFAPAKAIAIALRVARALAEAHAAGIVHRDLKPANVFLVDGDDDALHVKVLDFGIAKVKEQTTHERRPGLTQAGVVLGTPQYMSPEQGLGLRDVDARVDVWALGSVLFEMLSGRAPYPELPTYEQTILAIVRSPPPALRSVAPSVPAELAALVDEMLQHDRANRPPDCGAIVERLGDLARQTTPVPTPSHGVRAPSSRRASTLRISTIIAVVVGLIALASAFALGRRTSPAPLTDASASPGP